MIRSSSSVIFCALLSVIPHMVRAQVPVAENISVPSSIRALPGSLDKVEVLNSNSPEIVQQEGILVSTLAPQDKTTPQAHLNHCFDGRFDIFLHHISKKEDDQAPLYVAILMYNPGKKPITVDALSGASYLSQPDAPFIVLPPSEDNSEGNIFAGPGDRVANEVLRGQLSSLPAKTEVPPRQYALLAALPIPVKGLIPLLNGRTLLAHLQSSGPVQVATLAKFAAVTADGAEIAPTQDDWIELAKKGELAGPREKPASPLDAKDGFSYGRVAGVASGSQWKANIPLRLTKLNESISYPISSVVRGTFGTEQVESAPLLLREADTAYAAHGNYGIKYDITFDLENTSSKNMMALVKFQTPLKTDVKSDALQFVKTPQPRVFFRGTLRTSYMDAQGIKHEKYTHLVEHLGEQMTPLVAQYLLPKEKRTVRVEFIYPADATPPQMLTVESVEPESLLD